MNLSKRIEDLERGAPASVETAGRVSCGTMAADLLAQHGELGEVVAGGDADLATVSRFRALDALFAFFGVSTPEEEQDDDDQSDN